MPSNENGCSPPQVSRSHPRPLPEQPAYLEFSDAQIYVVIHRPSTKCRAVAFLPGPFPTERPYSYSAWVKWARFLAEHGVCAIRFDYRATGESSGEFEAMTFGTWITDAHDLLAVATPSDYRSLPLLMHGLGFGGLVASQIFKRGLGAALLTWSAPSSGADAMKEAFARRLMMDFVTAGPKRKSWDDYVAELNADRAIPVQGYALSGAMWKEAQQYALAVSAEEQADRLVSHVKLGRNAAPLIAGIGQWRALNPALQSGYVPLNPDFSGLFISTLDWIEKSLALPA